jgi:hypothetical protein
MKILLIFTPAILLISCGGGGSKKTDANLNDFSETADILSESAEFSEETDSIPDNQVQDTPKDLQDMKDAKSDIADAEVLEDVINCEITGCVAPIVCGTKCTSPCGCCPCSSLMNECSSDYAYGLSCDEQKGCFKKIECFKSACYKFSDEIGCEGPKFEGYLDCVTFMNTCESNCKDNTDCGDGWLCAGLKNCRKCTGLNEFEATHGSKCIEVRIETLDEDPEGELVITFPAFKSEKGTAMTDLSMFITNDYKTDPPAVGVSISDQTYGKAYSFTAGSKGLIKLRGSSNATVIDPDDPFIYYFPMTKKIPVSISGSSVIKPHKVKFSFNLIYGDTNCGIIGNITVDFQSGKVDAVLDMDDIKLTCP